MNVPATIAILRPRQWIKNLMLFFPPFLSGALFSSSCLSLYGLASFAAFCCASIALYIYNDYYDLERDLLHPLKQLRPMASGAVSTRQAACIAIFVVCLGVTLALFVGQPLIPYLLLYCAVMIAYTKWFKNIPVLDMFCISCGFLIRLQAGGAVFRVEISAWLFLSVFFLSLCLSSGKRLSEMSLLGSDAVGHRTSLCGYPEGTLDAILQISAATVLVTYTMYTFAHPQLLYTVPLCTFGIFRYILRVKEGKNGDPTESLFKDIPLFCASALWALLVAWSIYL